MEAPRPHNPTAATVAPAAGASNPTPAWACFLCAYADHGCDVPLIEGRLLRVAERVGLAGLPVALLGDVRWTHYWTRATNTLVPSRAHRYELRAARTFYGMYPEFLGVHPWAKRRHRLAAARTGRPVGADRVPPAIAQRSLR